MQTPEAEHTRVVDALVDDLCAAGLDIAARFGTASWKGDYALHEFGRQDCAGLVVGNSKALWPLFLETDPAGRHPLDRYVMQTISLAGQAAADQLGCAWTVHWAHVTRPAAIPIQRVAEAAGLARLGPAYLSVHPDHGPWFGLRAVLVFDAPGIPSAPAHDFCGPCQDQPCVAGMNRALALGAAATWRDWLAARDACPIGRDARYDDGQLRYHYTKDPSCLT